MIGDFLKAPTDSLYKFMCISGMILLVASVTYPIWHLNRSTHASIAGRSDTEVLKADVQALQDREAEFAADTKELIAEYDDLHRQTDALEKELNEAKAHPSNTKKEAILAVALRLTEIKSVLEEKRLKLEERRKTEQEGALTLHKKALETQYKLEAAIWEAKSGRLIIFFSVLGAFMGFWMMWKGLNLWSTRVQVFQDAILKKQAALNETKVSKSPKANKNKRRAK